jgi:hypothetical protein
VAVADCVAVDEFAWVFVMLTDEEGLGVGAGTGDGDGVGEGVGDGVGVGVGAGGTTTGALIVIVRAALEPFQILTPALAICEDAAKLIEALPCAVAVKLSVATFILPFTVVPGAV